MHADQPFEFDPADEAMLLMRCVQLLSDGWPADKWHSKELVRRASRRLVLALSAEDFDIRRAGRHLAHVDQLLHLSLRLRYADPRHLATLYVHVMRVRSWIAERWDGVADEDETARYDAERVEADTGTFAS